MIFVDTSALFAILDADSEEHAAVRTDWERLLNAGETLICTNYVLLETYALVQSQLGMAAVHTLHEDIVPVLKVKWIDEERHRAGMAGLLAADRRGLSLVDCTSFVAARELGVTTVLALDEDFVQEGFDCLPRQTS